MSFTEERHTDRKVASGPQMNTLYSDPDFSAPNPECVNEKVNTGNVIFNWGGVKIAKISPEVVVKFGSHVTISEAKNMMFVKKNTENIPVPKVFACYSYGPIHRDTDDYGSLYDTYIFMSFVEGQCLDRVWEAYDETTKNRIASQLKGYFHELRIIDNDNYIGSVDLGPVTDPILESHHMKGPFHSEEDFNNAIIDAYQSKAPRRRIKSFLAGMLSHSKHQIVFTHGDLRLQNIVVKDGNVSGILDWEFSGWYPEYWEFSKALYVWKWQNDWVEYLVQVLQPYYSEYAVHSFLTETLW